MTSLSVRKKTTPQAETKPSAALVAEAAKEVTVKAANGLTITLKKPGILSQFRLVKILGDAAKNNVYVSMVIPITFVTSIDGQAVRYPNTEREIEATIQRLDEEGVTAVMEAVGEHFGSATEDEQAEGVKN
ncbi:hypothetical protein [Paraburkholderia phosphatilytica]|uniref:hypothetical protein n=1 Tax=Paraburkholderia phosphatilytica TaxID=2282883 RepID=UPI000E4A2561|nr:hypothetical protein [Paraburkholderia phosphatilytica]